mgnify:CR=1 FL=1
MTLSQSPRSWTNKMEVSCVLHAVDIGEPPHRLARIEREATLAHTYTRKSDFWIQVIACILSAAAN